MVSERALGFSRVIAISSSHCIRIPPVIQRIRCIHQSHSGKRHRMQGMADIRNVSAGSLMGSVARSVGSGFLTQPPLLRGVSRIQLGQLHSHIACT